MAVLQILISVLCCCVLDASGDWVIQLDGEGNFQAAINSLQVLGHSREKPCLYIGSGSTVFHEHHGNFDIEDSIDRRIPLTNARKLSDSSVTFSSESDNSLSMMLEFVSGEVRFSVLPAGYDRVWVRFIAEEKEYVYGGGEQFTYLNMRGRRFPIWTREQGVGRNKSSQITFDSDSLSGGAGGDYHTTYYGEPTYFSSRGYTMHSTATYYTILDFTNTGYHEVEVHGNIGSIKMTGDVGRTISELSQEYVRSTGLMPALPDWMYTGAIIGLQGGTDRMNELLDKIESNGVSVSGVWIQDWSGRIKTSFGRRVFWNWEWNPEHYPNLDKEVPKLLARGIHVLTYINPYLNIEGPLFKEADKLGHFVRNSTNQTYIADFGEFYCGTIDLTNPAAVEWYKRRIVQRALDLGLSGWMADFSEYLMVDNARFHSGQSALELHNQWPVLWARLNREAVEDAGKLGKVVFWMRAGYAGASNFTTLFWAGDQNVDYTKSDGLASTIPAALSVGLQGIGLTHFDIGLFTSLFGLTRDKELFLRSAEYAVFTPTMRTHEGNRPADNWQLYSDDDTMKQFGRLVKMYLALSKYVKGAEKTYRQTGKPLQRALSYEYPADSGSWEVEYEYMYGDDLLVAPVLQSNVTEWKCYLPPGEWVHLWSDVKHSGKSYVTVSAPVGQPPVFYKSGSSYPWKDLKLPLIPPSKPGQPASSATRLSTSVSSLLALSAILTTYLQPS